MNSVVMRMMTMMMFTHLVLVPSALHSTVDNDFLPSVKVIEYFLFLCQCCTHFYISSINVICQPGLLWSDCCSSVVLHDRK